MDLAKECPLKTESGKPKICISITGVSQEEILSEALEIKNSSANIVEWRVDFYEDIFSWEKTKETLVKLKDLLSPLPLIFTFRTKLEGGNSPITSDEYKALSFNVLDSNLADFLDVEVFSYPDVVGEIIQYGKDKDTLIIGSNHDFFGTPNREEITQRLFKMKDLGCSVAKLAVMPQEYGQIFDLLYGTLAAKKQGIGIPLVTMSMGKLGKVTRLVGETFGSSMTFAALKKISAPGQIDADKVNIILNSLHKG